MILTFFLSLYWRRRRFRNISFEYFWPTRALFQDFFICVYTTNTSPILNKLSWECPMVRITKLANRWALSWVRNDKNSWWQRWHPRRCSSCPKKEMCCLDLQFAHICAEDLINNKRTTSSQTHSRGTPTQGDVHSKIVSNPYDSGTIDDAWV